MLGEITEQFNRVVAVNWPGVPVSIDFEPTVDLENGVLRTDLALRLAAALRVNPNLIAKEIVAGINGVFCAEPVVEKGYISFSPSILNLDDRLVELALLQGDQFSIALPLIGGRSWSRISAYRVAARACLQAKLLLDLGKNVKIMVADRVYEPENLGKLVELFPVITVSLMESHSLTDWSACAGQPVTVWLPYERTAAKKLQNQMGSSYDIERVVVQQCKKAWIQSPVDELPEVENLSQSELGALILYLAGELPSSEIDVAAASLKEKANLLWFLETLQQRVIALTDRLDGPDTEFSAEVDGLDESTRALCARLCFFNGFVQRAASYGAVGDLLLVVEDLCNRLNRHINSPTFRRNVDQGVVQACDLKILSGARVGLSDMMSSCSLHGVPRAR